MLFWRLTGGHSFYRSNNNCRHLVQCFQSRTASHAVYFQQQQYNTTEQWTTALVTLWSRQWHCSNSQKRIFTELPCNSSTAFILWDLLTLATYCSRVDCNNGTWPRRDLTNSTQYQYLMQNSTRNVGQCQEFLWRHVLEHLKTDSSHTTCHLCILHSIKNAH